MQLCKLSNINWGDFGQFFNISVLSLYKLKKKDFVDENHEMFGLVKFSYQSDMINLIVNVQR